MSDKKHRLTLERIQRVEYMTETDPHGYAYLVILVTNSIAPAVGEVITPAKADHYANSEFWEVTFK